jgi:hypothetical protein
MDTKIIYSQKLQKEDFKNWFIEDFYIFDIKCIDFVIKKNIFTFEDGRTTETMWSCIKIEGRFGYNIFLNRTGYFRIHYIDFQEKEVTGSIYEENMESVLKPEIYDQLHSKYETLRSENIKTNPE